MGASFKCGLKAPGLPGDLVMMAGCPVLIVPYVGTFETGGANVLVAWNASREAARAVHDALPILQRANKVTVVTIEPGAAGRIPGADICTYLSRHGVRAEAHNVIPGELAIGDTILNALADHGADLVVMGAYGHTLVCASSSSAARCAICWRS